MTGGAKGGTLTHHRAETHTDGLEPEDQEIRGHGTARQALARSSGTHPPLADVKIPSVPMSLAPCNDGRRPGGLDH